MGKVTTYEAQRYRHLPTVVAGILFDGTTRCAEAIMDWAPGKFTRDDYGKLCAFTPEGLRYVPDANTAMLDIEGLPYSVRPSIMASSYVPADGVDHRAVLSAAQVMQLRFTADDTDDVRQLREIIAQLASSHEAQRA